MFEVNAKNVTEEQRGGGGGDQLGFGVLILYTSSRQRVDSMWGRLHVDCM